MSCEINSLYTHVKVFFLVPLGKLPSLLPYFIVHSKMRVHLTLCKNIKSGMVAEDCNASILELELKGQKFKVSLNYIQIFRRAWVTRKPSFE